MLSRLFMGFSAGCFSLSRPLCSVNLSWTIFACKTTSRGTIPHIISNYPRAHYNAGLNTSAAVCRRRYLVSVRNLSIRCACNQTRVCRRECLVRRLPNESVPTEMFSLAASDGSVLAGGFRRHFYITSANSAFAAFFKSSGFRVSWTPILPPLTTILSRDAAPASIRVTYCFFMPMAVQPPRT